MSSCLVDTRVWLWAMGSPDRLSRSARAMLAADSTEMLLSAASSWEIAIKYGLGRLSLPAPPEEYVPDRIRASGTTPIGVEHSHVLRVAELPNHHRDPFDRLLISQARSLGIPLMTADRQLAAYDVEILNA